MTGTGSLLNGNTHLFWAYRLAKFEATAEHRGIGRVAFAAFEKDLPANLAKLEAAGLSPDRIFRSIQLGRIWVRPKAVKHSTGTSANGRIVCVPELSDEHQITGMTVRVLLEPSPEFATSELVWLLKFGVALDGVLSRECMANRLDVRGDPPSVAWTRRHVYRYWAPAYREFRSRAVAVARHALTKDNRRCVLVALDLAAYYDNIDPSFLVRPDFVGEVEATAATRMVSFRRDEYLAATEGLLLAFERYRSEVAQTVGVEAVVGIPIGAITSRLIANLALVDLDRQLVQKPGVIHYARYVDDILLVRRASGVRPEPTEETVAGLLPLKSGRKVKNLFILDERGLRRAGSRFTVQPTKLRVFDLEGDQGLEYLGAVAAEMERLSSERRRFLEPWTSESDRIIASSPGAEPIRALREADALRLRKLAASTTCSKVETAAVMLSRDEASAFSRRYLARAGRLATDWSQWVDLLDVSMRILAAALLAGDAETGNAIIEAIKTRVNSLVGGRGHRFPVHWGTAKLPLARTRGLIREWVAAQITEIICSAAVFDERGFLSNGVGALVQGLDLGDNVVGPSELLDSARLLARADLRMVDCESDHELGCQQVLRSSQVVSELELALEADAAFVTRLSGLKGFIEVCQGLGDPVYSPKTAVDLLLSARPPTYSDILFRWIRAGMPLEELLGIINAVRGTQYPVLPLAEEDRRIIVEPASNVSSGETRVVLGNLCSEPEWWAASVTAPVLTVQREERFARVLNQGLEAARVARRQGRPTVLVLPELSVPRRWVREVVKHISRSAPELSLVAGLEYDVAGKDVCNEVMAFVPRPRFAAAAWIWSKGRPSHEERRGLEKMGFHFKARDPERRFHVLSSEHGDLLPLVCSELLEVDSRARILGRVNLVLVPAWNQDTGSFEYLVHSSALELHSFVAIANNGVFSDCRIRGPYGEQWRREVARLIARHENETLVADIPIGRLLEYRANPQEYEGRRKAWLDQNKDSSRDCPWPAWKPMPPGMLTGVVP